MKIDRVSYDPLPVGSYSISSAQALITNPDAHTAYCSVNKAQSHGWMLTARMPEPSGYNVFYVVSRIEQTTGGVPNVFLVYNEFVMVV